MRNDCFNRFGLEEQSQKKKNIEWQVNRYFRGEKQSKKGTRKGCIQVATHLANSKQSY